MPKIEICLTHELIHQHELRGKIVVVTDIFRATSCMVAGLANGIVAIKPVLEVETCLDFQKLGYLAGGERHAQKIEGFELDNSPFSYMNQSLTGKKVAMTTTNGTLTINKAKPEAKEVLAASFLNLSATANYLSAKKLDVVVVCAGWKGSPGLEDVIFGGALVEKLAPDFVAEGDSSILAHSAFLQAENKLLDYLQNASHLKRLKNLDGGVDIPFCLKTDVFGIVVKLNAEGELVASN